jgi:hypothetical protein
MKPYMSTIAYKTMAEIFGRGGLSHLERTVILTRLLPRIGIWMIRIAFCFGPALFRTRSSSKKKKLAGYIVDELDDETHNAGQAECFVPTFKFF